jgi:hypothetical protein
MSQVSYSTGSSAANKRPEPTLKDVLYSSIEELEDILKQRPQFQDGLTRIMSSMVAHECRIIGF